MSELKLYKFAASIADLAGDQELLWRYFVICQETPSQVGAN